MDIDWAPDRVLAAAGVVDMDDAIQPLPEGVPFNWYAIPVRDSVKKIPGATMKDKLVLQVIIEFFKRQVNLLFFAHDFDCRDVDMSICGGQNGAVFVSLNPCSVTGAVGDGCVDLIEGCPIQEVMLIVVTAIPARFDPSSSFDHGGCQGEFMSLKNHRHFQPSFANF